MVNKRISIAAVIATKNRPYDLQNVSLPSILSQTKKPEFIIIVDDSDKRFKHLNEQISISTKTAGIKMVYLENYRTPGASGAWNTALYWLMRQEYDFFVAILDDDDSWDRHYLELCFNRAAADDLDMVAAGLIRYDDDHKTGKKLSIPEQLQADELLWRNPHIQGSNLFIRLEVLLEAGGFDEYLSSTTDRDLCIRIADLGYVKYGIVSEHLVHHYSCSDRSRISTKGSGIKHQGLDAFYNKYRGRMSNEVRDRFLQRSWDLFQWKPKSCYPVVMVQPSHTLNNDDVLTSKFIVGTITSPDITHIQNLLSDLTTLRNNSKDIHLQVIILENSGTDNATRRSLNHSIINFREQGLAIQLISLEQQNSDLAEFISTYGIDATMDRKDISTSRTLLQIYLQIEGRLNPDAIIWILDDDSRIDNLVTDGSSILHSPLDLGIYSRILKEANHSIVLGTITGEPPLPFSSCIRTQMVDLYHNLSWFSTLQSTEILPSRKMENQLMRSQIKDYYYDLSHWETNHLEMPFWYIPGDESLNVKNAIVEMLIRVPCILDGIEVFRPLIMGCIGEPERQVIPSIHRGGNTFILDHDSLRLFPNIVPTSKDREARRSDMVWCILNKYMGGRTVVEIPLPVRQERNVKQGYLRKLDLGKLGQDIQGFAFYSALHEVQIKKARERQMVGSFPWGEDFLDISDDEAAFFVDRYMKHLSERFFAFEMNSFRVRGLFKCIRFQLDSDAWWCHDPDLKKSRELLNVFMEHLEGQYDKAKIDTFKKHVIKVDQAYLHEFIRGLKKRINAFRDHSTKFPPRLTQRIKQHITKRYSITASLRELGQGAEGIVFTDGINVFKYFHYWKAHDREEKMAFLHDLVDKWNRSSVLYPIIDFTVDDGKAILVYPFEPNEKYNGGYLEDVIRFLRECRDYGIACTNVHTSNFRVTKEGLRFIDYGSDLRPYSEGHFESMCRRAFLMYLFPEWKRLKQLMRRSIYDIALPELHRFPHFRRAVDPRSLLEILDPFIICAIDRFAPSSILDFGSGDGRIAMELNGKEYSVVCYDPDPEVIHRGKILRPSLNFIGTHELSQFRCEGATFDLILCSMVLCTLHDDEDVSQTLQQVRPLIGENGIAIFVICNPFYSFTKMTEFQSRRLPEDVHYFQSFPITKTLWNGSTRMDHHRSLDTYRRLLDQNDLRLIEMAESDGSDIKNLLPASDFLMLKVRPRSTTQHNVSILIKTCAMEWQWIESGIRHIVRQLEGNGHILEKVVVTDDYADTFLRQYEKPDHERHRFILERLLAEDVIDRVVYAPYDERSIRSTNQRWFNEDTVTTHAANGQNVYPTLYGIDACEGEYVLQMDSDLLFGRRDRDYDIIGDIIKSLESNEMGLSTSFNIMHSSDIDYTTSGPQGDWRVEVRCSMIKRSRINAVLPIRNEVINEAFALPWHRAFDRFIRHSAYSSLRGGDHRSFFIHIPNERKSDSAELYAIADRIEIGDINPAQLGNINLVGTYEDWIRTKRIEPFIFIICCRNVYPGLFKDCWSSVVGQHREDWGAVIVDGGSTNGLQDYIEMLTIKYRDRVTIVKETVPRGVMYSTWLAISNFCSNPNSVIITLDADDALIGKSVLDRIKEEYDQGADVTIGSMLRVDKEKEYPVNLKNPRENRGGNVWQHLRTFRKHLFDRIKIDDLKVDGEWINIATDWLFMLPIVEMAENPRHIKEKLYYYDPGPEKDSRRGIRENVIARIVAKQSYRAEG